MITCFDIGGSAIKSAAAHTPDDIRAQSRVPTPLDDFDAFASAITTLIDPASDPALPIPIGITGVVDPENGNIKCANIPCIDGRPLAADLSHRIGRRILVANDADCFALAEATVGAGRGHRIVFGAILGTGVGGGVVVDGKLLPGAGGFSGEWGHGPILKATRTHTDERPASNFQCGCGQTGCVDTVGGARGLERLHKLLWAQTLPSTAIVAAWQAHDSKATKTIERMIDMIADPLALTINITGASIVPVGGGLGGAAGLVPLLDRTVRARILRRTSAQLIVPAGCAGEPGLVGAGVLGLANSDNS